MQGVSLEVCLDHSLTHVYGTGIVVNKVPFSLQIMLGIHGASMCCKGSCISNKCFAVSSFFFSYVRGSMSKLRTCASSSRFLLDLFIYLFISGGGGGGGRAEECQNLVSQIFMVSSMHTMHVVPNTLQTDIMLLILKKE